MGKSSSPPDYTGAAEKQAEGDFRNLQWQTRANRPDMYTPWGSSTWYPGQNGYYRNQVTLDPKMQQALDAQQEIGLQRSNTALGMMGNAQQEMQTPEGFWEGLGDYSSSPAVPTYDRSGYQQYQMPDTGGLGQNLPNVQGPQQTTRSGGLFGGLPQNINMEGMQDIEAKYDPRFEQTMYKRAMSLLRPQQEQDLERQRTQMLNMGHSMGGEGYDDALYDLRNTQAEQNQRVAWDSVMAGAQEYDRDFNRRLSARGQQFGERSTDANYGLQRAGFGLGEQAQDFGQQQGMANFGEGQRAARFGEQMGVTDAGFRSANLANSIRNQQAGEDLSFGSQQFGQDMQSANYANQLRQQQIAEQLQREGWSLNKINAFLSQQQVQMPQMPGFSNAGYVGGPNYLGATQQQTAWDGSVNNMWGDILGAAAGGFFGRG